MWHNTCKESSLCPLGGPKTLFPSLTSCVSLRPSWKLRSSAMQEVALHWTVGSTGCVFSISFLLYSPTELAGVWRKLAWKWRRRNLELFSLNMDGLVHECRTHQRGWDEGGGSSRLLGKPSSACIEKLGGVFLIFKFTRRFFKNEITMLRIKVNKTIRKQLIMVRPLVRFNCCA